LKDRNMAHPKIGDIVEIATKRGFAYAQFTHKHKMYGALLRLLPGFYDHRPADLARLASSGTKFVTFFPLGAAVNRGIVEVVGNMAVPDEAKPFPLFRAGTPDRDTKKVNTWWLWDGEKAWRVGELTPEQMKLPIRGIWNDTALVERLESDWLPENNSW
jgi:hypothetical protein